MADMVMRINRAVETIEVRDEDGDVAYSWRVATDDRSIERMRGMVAAATAHYREVRPTLRPDGDEAERRRATEENVRMMRLVITAVVGEQGWHDVLAYIGGGEECDPMEYSTNIGEVFGMLFAWMADHCGSKELRRVSAAGTPAKDGRQGFSVVSGDKKKKRSK